MADPTVDPLQERGEYEETLTKAEVEAQRVEFEELGRIQEEEGLVPSFEVPVTPIPEWVLNPPPSEFEGTPMVGFLADTNKMSEAELFRALCKAMGDDPDEVIEEIKTHDEDGKAWLRERGIK